MDNKATRDITEVCRLLGTTSRTLRFYEEKGIISATNSPFSLRRRYTEEQIEQIRCVLLLRTLGLSIKAIAELQRKESDLRRALLNKRAEIYARLETLTGELRLLHEALTLIEAGGTVYSVQTEPEQEIYTGEFAAMLTQCTEAIVKGDTATLYEHMGASLSAVLPPLAFEAARAEALEPLGKLKAYGKLTASPDHPDAFIHIVCYGNLCLKITYVLCGGQIEGLWMTYSDP